MKKENDKKKENIFSVTAIPKLHPGNKISVCIDFSRME
jgi:hypothetical protein